MGLTTSHVVLRIVSLAVGAVAITAGVSEWRKGVVQQVHLPLHTVPFGAPLFLLTGAALVVISVSPRRFWWSDAAALLIAVLLVYGWAGVALFLILGFILTLAVRSRVEEDRLLCRLTDERSAGRRSIEEAALSATRRDSFPS